MKILAIDTSSIVASVAIVNEHKLLTEITINNKKTHSEVIMPMIDLAIGSLGLVPTEIDVFAVANGPGSFTGIRIGVSTVKSLAQALNKPVAGISGLDGLAYNLVGYEGFICPLMDARNGQVYTCLYKSNGQEIKKLYDYMAVRVTDLIQLLQSRVDQVMFCGDATMLHKNLLEEKLGTRAKFAQPAFMFQKASSIAFLALQKSKSEVLLNYNELQPLYLRKSQAEQKLDSSRKRENHIGNGWNSPNGTYGS